MVVAKFANTTQHGAIEGKTQTHEIEYFNLEMVTSVGYRVKSNRGVQFRKWTNRVLKDYLVKGYAINDRIRRDQISELRQLVQMVGRTIQTQQLDKNDENQALFDIVVDYTYALDTLDDYDYQRLSVGETTQDCFANPDLWVEKIGFVDVKSPEKVMNCCRNANHASKVQHACVCLTDHCFKKKPTERQIEDRNKAIWGSEDYHHDFIFWLIDGNLRIYKRP